MAILCSVCHKQRNDSICYYCGTTEKSYNEEAWRGDLPEYLTNMNALKAQGFTPHFNTIDKVQGRITPLHAPLYPVWYSKSNKHLWYDTINEIWILATWKGNELVDHVYSKELHFIINHKL